MVYKLLFILGIAGIIDTIILSFYTNINTGTVLPGIAGLLVCIFAYLKAGSYKNKPLIKNVILRRMLTFVFIIGLLSFTALEAVIIINGTSQSDRKTDYLIIPGAGINGDVVSLALKERLDKGIEYLNRFPGTKVIVSGGQGYGEIITEAEAMRRYLVDKGIQDEDILLEEMATSTLENFLYSKEVILSSISEVNVSDNIKIMIITNDFHMFRSKMLARRAGFEPYGISCKTPVQVRLNCYLRESLAIVKSFFLDRV